MRKLVLVLAAAGMVTPVVCQDPAPDPRGSKVMPAPALPYFDWKACPFEGCAYREWTARKSITVYDTWEQKRRRVASLSAGDKVTGLTGVVITYRPGTIRMDRDLPEEGLRRGDTILVYTNRGEGFAAAWFKGRFYSEFDISFAKGPDDTGCSGAHCAATLTDLGKVSWWAQVKLSSGRMGWVDMNEAEFDGVDLLGSRSHLTVARA
jgi:hypothetical protein